MSDDQDALAVVLSEFARTMTADRPVHDSLDRLVQRIVEVLPVTAAGVTLFSPPNRPRYSAASDPHALWIEKLQMKVGQGPALLAHSSGTPVAEPDLHVSTQFPQFAGLATQAGMAAVFAFPLRYGEQPLGALSLYRDVPGQLDAEVLRPAQALADVAAAYLLNDQARRDWQHAAGVAHHHYLHDHLTGLPNRVLLLERLSQALRRTVRSGAVCAVLFVDLDGFKAINDQDGHAAGDELLTALGGRLTASVRPADTVARLHGDEFVILCEDLHQPGEAHDIATRIDLSLKQPFSLLHGSVVLTASVGVAFADRTTAGPERSCTTPIRRCTKPNEPDGQTAQTFRANDHANQPQTAS